MLNKGPLILVIFFLLVEHYLCIQTGFLIEDGTQFTEMVWEKYKNLTTPPDSIQLKYFEALVDNFDETDKRTWKMRYFERLDFFSNDGPLYVYIGGESEQSDVRLRSGLVYEIAQETGGAMFVTEHRYYGESLPLGPVPDNMPLTDYFKYLTTRQELADLAAFVKYLKDQPQFTNSQVVLIGGSYAGDLAAWFRLLYPDLVSAALASSAPVQVEVDFREYLEVVTDVYRRIGSQECVDKIYKTFERIAADYNTVEGMDRIKNEYNICPDSNITGILQYVAQQYIISSYVDEIQNGNYTKIYYHCSNDTNIDNTSPCVPISIKNYTLTGRRLVFMYQQCTELGYFQTTNSEKQMFSGRPLEYYYQLCKRNYGIEREDVNRAVQETNEYYGGRNINVTEVLFVNGLYDPWHTLSILESSESYIAIVIPDGYHTSDLLVENEEVAEKEINIIKKWIGM